MQSKYPKPVGWKEKKKNDMIYLQEATRNWLLPSQKGQELAEPGEGRKVTFLQSQPGNSPDALVPAPAFLF